MGITSFGLILFILFIAGIAWLVYRRRYKLLLFSAGIPILIIGVLITILFYQPKPDDLAITITKEGNHYTANGKWQKPLDYYHFPTDYLILTLPKEKKALHIKRPRYSGIQEMDNKTIQKDMLEWLEKKPAKDKHLQIVDIEPSKHFAFSFDLPEGVSLNDVDISYVHARSEPMDGIVFWEKKVKNK